MLHRPHGPGATAAPTVIVTSPDQLAELVTAAVAAALAELAPATAPPALLDRAGLARACTVSVATVDRWAAAGCPVVRIGAAPRYELASVLEWLRAGGAQ